MVAGAMQAGAAGVSIGRNAFQHEKPQAIMRAIVGMVHEGRSVQDAMAALAAS
jgi:class I fructose-bisphosphate aldolase